LGKETIALARKKILACSQKDKGEKKENEQELRELVGSRLWYRLAKTDRLGAEGWTYVRAFDWRKVNSRSVAGKKNRCGG